MMMRDMCIFFIGPAGRVVFDVSVTIFSFVSMWLYAVLFAQSLADTLPLHFITGGENCNLDDGLWGIAAVCRVNYWFYLLIFLVLMLLVSTQNIAQQIGLQQALSILAFGCIAVMLATLGGALGQYGHSPRDDYEAAPRVFDLEGFGKAFATFVFAQLAHHGVPGIVELMEDRSKCRGALLGGILTTCTIYLILGIMIALFFGTNSQGGVNKVVTLNWESYDEGGKTFAHAISYLVRLYPCASVGAAFPLYADVLGKNWEAAMSSEMKSKIPSWLSIGIAFRWSSMIPAFIGASLMVDASLIISIGGLFGFAIELILPALLQIYSIRQCQERWGMDGTASDTPYSWHFSQIRYAWGTLIFSGVALLYSCVNLVMHP